MLIQSQDVFRPIWYPLRTKFKTYVHIFGFSKLYRNSHIWILLSQVAELYIPRCNIGLCVWYAINEMNEQKKCISFGTFWWMMVSDIDLRHHIFQSNLWFYKLNFHVQVSCTRIHQQASIYYKMPINVIPVSYMCHDELKLWWNRPNIQSHLYIVMEHAVVAFGEMLHLKLFQQHSYIGVKLILKRRELFSARLTASF